MAGRTSGPLAAFVLSMGLIGASPTVATARETPTAEAQEPSRTVVELANWAVRSGDNQNLPFAIVDKGAAMVAVFDAEGRMLGAGAALVGSATGDESTPGIGDRELSDVAPEERTTPAGRFVGGYGPAEGQRQVLWVDYATAISLHPVVTTNPEEKRLQRLESPTADDNRITYGCINVSADFYEDVVRPTFSETKGVFYVLPDTLTLAEAFPNFGAERLVSTSAKRRAPRRPFAWW